MQLHTAKSRKAHTNASVKMQTIQRFGRCGVIVESIYEICQKGNEGCCLVLCFNKFIGCQSNKCWAKIAIRSPFPRSDLHFWRENTNLFAYFEQHKATVRFLLPLCFLFMNIQISREFIFLFYYVVYVLFRWGRV